MDRIVWRLFDEFISCLDSSDYFTSYDFMDYVRTRAPKYIPSGVTVGYLAKLHPRVYRIADNRKVYYGVIN